MVVVLLRLSKRDVDLGAESKVTARKPSLGSPSEKSETMDFQSFPLLEFGSGAQHHLSRYLIAKKILAPVLVPDVIGNTKYNLFRQKGFSSHSEVRPEGWITLTLCKMLHSVLRDGFDGASIAAWSVGTTRSSSSSLFFSISSRK